MGVLRLGDPPLWRLIVTNLDGEVVTLLDGRASERQFVFTLNGPASHTGLVPSDDPMINLPAPAATSPALLSHNTRLVYGLRREIRPAPGDPPYHSRFSGIVMSCEDVGADTPTTRYSAYDPWAYLMCRPIRKNDGTLPGSDGIIYNDARASDMALDLLANTVTVDGDVFIDASDGSLLDDTDVIPGKTRFERGLSVGEAWTQLCDTGTIEIRLRPIYDPLARPGVLCDLIIKKQIGQIRYNTVLGWDLANRSLTELSRLIDGTRLANRVRAYAGQGGPAVPTQSDAASIARYGEYWAQIFAQGTQSPLVALLALAQLQIRKRGAVSVTMTPAPERSYLALRDYSLGDYVPVWASRSLREPLGVNYAGLGAFAVSLDGAPLEGEELEAVVTPEPGTAGAVGYERLYVIPIDLDDNGVERPHDLVTSQDTATTA